MRMNKTKKNQKVLLNLVSRFPWILLKEKFLGSVWGRGSSRKQTAVDQGTNGKVTLDICNTLWIDLDWKCKGKKYNWS